MKEITELGLSMVEQLIRNNVWLLHDERILQDPDSMDSVSAISLSWENQDDKNVIKFAVRCNGEWKSQQVIAEKDEDDRFDIYGLAIKLAKGVSWKN